VRDAAGAVARFIQERRQFILFLVIGGIAALVNILSRIVLNPAMPYEIAVFAAFLCGMTVAFWLGRQFVFKPSGRAVADEYLRFGLVNLVALAQVWIISVGLARLVFPAIGFTYHADTVAHVIGVVAPVFTSYLGHKYFSFQPKRAP
jgi:putative flippase GtrA